MKIGAKLPQILISACLATSQLASAETASNEVDFAQTRESFMRELETDVGNALAQPRNKTFKNKVAVFFGLKSTQDKEINERLARMLAADALPSDDFVRAPKFELTKLSTVNEDISYVTLRGSAIIKAKGLSASVAKRLPGGNSPVQFVAVTCADETNETPLHGLLTEGAFYDMDTQTVEYCDRYMPMTGNWRTWEKSFGPSSRAPASADPENILPIAPDETIENDRSPASVPRKVARKPVQKTKGGKQRVAATTSTAAPMSRKSRLPSSVEDGFELRVQQGKLISTFWVVKRGDRRDLMFANNAGSKTTLSLPPESFSYLHDAALSLRSEPADISKCKTSRMQIHVVTEGQSERSIAACVQGRGKSAEGIRTIGTILSSMVR